MRVTFAVFPRERFLNLESDGATYWTNPKGQDPDSHLYTHLDEAIDYRGNYQLHIRCILLRRLLRRPLKR